MVNRAAGDIAAGRLDVTLIAGAEGIRSSRARHARGLPRLEGDTSLAPDPVVGDDLPGTGPAEAAAGLLAPVHVYPLFENVVAARAGHDTPAHRRAMGRLFAPFTDVAASHPCAWFPERRSADELATPSADNRVVAEPYTKRLVAFLGSDQGAALLVCSLAAARRAGVAGRAVFVWAGAEATDVRFPTSRPDPGRSPGIAAAGASLWAAASAAGGGVGRLGIDDPAVLDIYSCFPSAVELACEALGLATDDRRGLTVTGGLPYFGGPGNNYTTHGIATVTDRLRERPARRHRVRAGHRPRVVRDQARAGPVRHRPSPGRLPAGGHRRRPGGHRRHRRAHRHRAGGGGHGHRGDGHGGPGRRGHGHRRSAGGPAGRRSSCRRPPRRRPASWRPWGRRTSPGWSEQSVSVGAGAPRYRLDGR